jgi:hypothetical protein
VVGLASLRQFLKFATEYVIHPQAFCNLLGDIQEMRPAGIHVDFL